MIQSQVMNKAIFIIPLLFISFCVKAQTPWSLKDCIDYALKNNRTGTVYANEKKAADAKAKEALAAYLPSISLTGTLDNNLKLQQTVIPGGVFGPDDIRVAFSKQYNANGVAQLDQTIYDQSLLTGLKANKLNQQQASLNETKNQEDIIYQVTNSYYQIFVYREQLIFLKENAQDYGRQQEIVSLQVNKGVVLKKEQDRVTVDLNNTLSQIRVAETNVELAKNQLKYDMGFPMEASLSLDSIAAEEAKVFRLPSSLEPNLFSFNNLTDYQLSKINSNLLQIDEKRIKATGLPKLTAYAKYGSIGFGDNLKQSFSTASSYSAVGLKLSFPIFDFFKRNAQYQQAKIKRMNAQEQLKLDEGKYQLAYKNAEAKLIKNQAEVESNRRNISLAQSVLEVTDRQYQKGTTDMTDWLNEQRSLKEAQNNYLNSLYNLFLSRIELEKSQGTLKTFYSAL